MPKTISFEQEEFRQGLVLLEDDSKAPLGSARKMLNTMISDRGGITSRPGTALFGDYNSATDAQVGGLFNYVKSFGDESWLLRAYKDKLEYYHPTAGWQLLKGSLTANAEFDFTISLVNVDSQDYVYFGNGEEKYMRWSGEVTTLTADVAGSETELPVESTVKEQILEAGVVDSATATTITIGSEAWATDIWKSFYVLMTSGDHEGKLRKITGNTADTLTFETLGTAPSASDTFQIRQLKFPESGTVIYNGNTLAYTAITTNTSLTVSSPHVATSGTPVTIIPEEFVEAPRGNIIENLLGRVYIGRVKSAVSRDVSDNIQGSTQVGSVFVSNILDPKDFSFAATRIAGEGDIVAVPYGGGRISDIKAIEDVIYIYKPSYIEALKYSGDVNDIAIRQPIKTGVGSINRVVQGDNDHYFMTEDSQYTSLGRVSAKDILPQTENIGHRIKRLLNDYGHDEFVGIEYGNRIFSAHKFNKDDDENNVVLIFNKESQTFEGIWSLAASAFEQKDGKLYFGESQGANVWEMMKKDKVDFIDTDTELPYTSTWQSNFFNLLPVKSNIQGVNTISLEGYITRGTTFEFKLFKDFQTTAEVEFSFGGLEDEDNFITSQEIGAFLGANPLALEPLGTIDEPDENGRRRFQFMVYFPWVYGQYFSTAILSEGTRQDWEIVRIGLGLQESVSTVHPRIKTT